MTGTTQSEVITLFEDNTTLLRDYSDHIRNLNVLRDIVEPRHFSLQTDGSFRIMHYVGFFQRGKTRVQILPKVFQGVVDPQLERQKGLEFIFRLLHWSGFLKYKNLDTQQIGTAEADIVEILISLFINEFNNLFRRKIFRKYEEIIEPQQFIKGKILFADTFRANPILHHIHVVKFDEYSINNPLNRIFKTLLSQLSTKTNSKDNKMKIAQGLTYLQDVDTINLSTESFNGIKFNRLNTEFEPLFNLARLFFYNQQPGLNMGQEKTFSFLIPLNQLFEHFIGKVLLNLSDPSFTFHFQKNRIHLLSTSSGNESLLKPDYSVTHVTQAETIVSIIDAKYKSPFAPNGKVDLKESDIYQMCTYALRYNVKNLILIYPKLLNTKYPNSLLENYTINSGLGHINLKAIQVDLFENSLTEISTALKQEVYPKPAISISTPINFQRTL